MSAALSTRPQIDIGRTLDEGAFSTFQKIIVILAALSIVLDGFDGQMIGFAIPVIMKEWGVSRSEFAPAVAAGLIGMGLGSAFAGVLADRFGRRWAIICSVLVFGVGTCLIGLAESTFQIAALRFIAGLGVGGALPSSTTLTAEFTPARHRTMAITATIVCVPLGGMLAGFFASHVLPAYGWRWLFFAAGALPVAFGLLLIWALPESPRYLSRRPERWAELSRLLGRMSRPVALDAQFRDPAEQAHEKQAGIKALFSAGFGRDTVALWGAFFMCLLAVYSAFSWLPTLLSSQGLSVATAASGLTAYNLGGVIGALGCAVAISKFGSRWPLVICCAGGAASAFWLKGVDLQNDTALLIYGIGLHGLFVNAVQSTVYAVCAYIYPCLLYTSPSPRD